VATNGYFPAKRSVGIKLLKNRLSKLRSVGGRSETVLVTDRDRVLVKLGPPASG
jgi:hypothetical protein